MLRNLLAVVGVVVLGTLTRADDLKKLQGTWAPTSAQMGVQTFPKETLQQLRLQITDSGYLVQMGQVADRGSIKLNEEAKPATMDIVGTEGPNKGQTFAAIYEIDGDELIICYSLEGKKRPQTFRVDQVNNYFRVTYKRMK